MTAPGTTWMLSGSREILSYPAGLSTKRNGMQAALCRVRFRAARAAQDPLLGQRGCWLLFAFVHLETRKTPETPKAPS